MVAPLVNAIRDTEIQLFNQGWLRGVNNAGNDVVDILKIDGLDAIVIGNTSNAPVDRTTSIYLKAGGAATTFLDLIKDKDFTLSGKVDGGGPCLVTAEGFDGPACAEALRIETVIKGNIRIAAAEGLEMSGEGCPSYFRATDTTLTIETVTTGALFVTAAERFEISGIPAVAEVCLISVNSASKVTCAEALVIQTVGGKGGIRIDSAGPLALIANNSADCHLTILSKGLLDIDSTDQINIDAAKTSNFTVIGDSEQLRLEATGLASTILLTSTNINLDVDGNLAITGDLKIKRTTGGAIPLPAANFMRLWSNDAGKFYLICNDGGVAKAVELTA